MFIIFVNKTICYEVTQKLKTTNVCPLTIFENND